MSMRRFCLCLAVSLAGVSLLSPGCGRTEKATDIVRIQLNWFHEAEFVGYYVAESLGFYDDENLDVTILEGGPAVQARLAILDGSADFAVSSFAEQRGLLDVGEPAVAVMTVFQIPPLVMFALTDADIHEPADLVGKRVGIKNNYWRDIAHETLRNAGVDPSGIVEVEVDADAQQLLYDRQVDVWMGYAHDEPIEAQVAGYDVTSIYPANFGVGGYEGLLLVNQSTLDGNPDLVRRLVRASRRGWQYALEHPGEAADILAGWQPKNDSAFHRLAIRALIPLVDTPQAPIGWIDAARWTRLMGPGYDPQRPGFTTRFLQD